MLRTLIAAACLFQICFGITVEVGIVSPIHYICRERRFSDIIPLKRERMSCNVHEAFKMIGENASNPKFKIIDVRTPAEYQQSHLKGAHLIPLSDLGQRLAEFKQDETYLMVCRSGARSGNATSILRSKGLKAINMEGGIVSWMGSKFPTESS